jgi:hypothetical protein
VALDKERGRDVKQQNYNIRFYGNPGTGKTSVARLYAALLQELGVLPEAAVEETSGAALVNGGVAGLKKMLEQKLKEGGVLFIDEAYQLNPETNPLGAQVGAVACTINTIIFVPIIYGLPSSGSMGGQFLEDTSFSPREGNGPLRGYYLWQSAQLGLLGIS